MAALLGLAPIAAHVFDPIRNSAGNLVFGSLIISAGLGLVGLAVWDLILARFPGPLAVSLPDPLRRRYEWREQNTYDALTDRRVILWEPAPTFWRSVQVRSIRARDLSGTSRTQRADGSGDVSLEVVGAQINEVSGPRTLGRLRRLEKVREVDVLVRASLLPD